MRVKVINESVRFKDVVYSTGEIIKDFPEEEAGRLSKQGFVKVLEVDKNSPEHKISELEKEVETLKAENEALKQELASLKTKKGKETKAE